MSETPMRDASKEQRAIEDAREEVKRYLFDCAAPIVGHNFTDYEQHALFHRFKRVFEQLSAAQARVAEVERSRRFVAAFDKVFKPARIGGQHPTIVRRVELIGGPEVTELVQAHAAMTRTGGEGAASPAPSRPPEPV